MASMSTLNNPTPDFLGIPVESRGRIYQYVFAGARLYLNEMTGYSKLLEMSRTHDKYNATTRMIELTCSIYNEDTAILFTCHQMLQEGPEFLAKAATLVIDSVWARQDPTTVIASSFLNRVRNLEIEYHAFIHVDRKSMGALKNVTIIKAREGIEETGAGYHLLTCKKCGGKNGERFIENAMHGTLSWEWFMRQVLHLSKEEGWNVVLCARLEYTMDPEFHYLEAVADLESLEATEKRGVWNGKYIELEDWLECFQSYKLDTGTAKATSDPFRTWVL